MYPRKYKILKDKIACIWYETFETRHNLFKIFFDKTNNQRVISNSMYFSLTHPYYGYNTHITCSSLSKRLWIIPRAHFSPGARRNDESRIISREPFIDNWPRLIRSGWLPDGTEYDSLGGSFNIPSTINRLAETGARKREARWYFWILVSFSPLRSLCSSEPRLFPFFHSLFSLFTS